MTVRRITLGVLNQSDVILPERFCNSSAHGRVSGKSFQPIAESQSCRGVYESRFRRDFLRRSAIRVVSTPRSAFCAGSRRSAFRRSGADRRSFPFGESILLFSMSGLSEKGSDIQAQAPESNLPGVSVSTGLWGLSLVQRVEPPEELSPPEPSDGE